MLNLKKNGRRLFVDLKDKNVFNAHFLNELTVVYSMGAKDEISEIYFSCEDSTEFGNLCLVYLYSCMRYLAHYKKVFWHDSLKVKLLNNVETRTYETYSSVTNFQDELNRNNVPLYKFKKIDDITSVVDDLCNLLLEKNITTDKVEVKEFLSTTFGEIFSNAVLHSNMDSFYYAYDIDFNHEENEIFLIANIIDYGTTLVRNVKDYFKGKGIGIDSKSSFKWAIGRGNTTKIGSGGYGLATFFDYIKVVEGKIMMFSDDAACYYDKDKLQVKIVKGIFPGTSVTFKVPLYQLDKVFYYDSKNNKLSSKAFVLEDI